MRDGKPIFVRQRARVLNPPVAVADVPEIQEDVVPKTEVIADTDLQTSMSEASNGSAGGLTESSAVASNVEEALAAFDEKSYELDLFMTNVQSYISNHPYLRKDGHPKVHSYRSRLKNRDHLRDKIDRKIAEGRTINNSTIFSEITDLAGVRILHLFQEDFEAIDHVIRLRVDSQDWVLAEQPKAYTWDPEAAEFFKHYDLNVSTKDTSYTSVHYLLRPRPDSPVCCEVQVRTLFEEIWGEVDHRINYPMPSDSVACREQLKVLSKITGAGSRLLDSLQRVHRDHTKKV